MFAIKLNDQLLQASNKLKEPPKNVDETVEGKSDI